MWLCKMFLLTMVRFVMSQLIIYLLVCGGVLYPLMQIVISSGLSWVYLQADVSKCTFVGIFSHFY